MHKCTGPPERANSPFNYFQSGIKKPGSEDPGITTTQTNEVLATLHDPDLNRKTSRP